MLRTAKGDVIVLTLISKLDRTAIISLHLILPKDWVPRVPKSDLAGLEKVGILSYCIFLKKKNKRENIQN